MLTDSNSRRGRWGQDRRLEFIDSRLTWQGRINRKELTEFFKISVPQASLDLAEYQARAPANVLYDRNEKAYLATADFQPIMTDGSSARYLAELYALSTGIVGPDVSFLGWTPTADVVRHPTRTVSPSALRSVAHAIRERGALNIHYQTMTRSEPTARVISPRAFAYDGFRWHVRAYCHLREDFRDFVFARILDMAPASAAGAGPHVDEEWERELSIVIGPNPLLDENRKRVLALDYGMANGRLVLQTRQALAFYLLRRLGLDKSMDKPPEEQQIILLNREELVPFLPQLQTKSPTMTRSL